MCRRIIIIILITSFFVSSSFSFLPIRIGPTADLDAVVVKEKPASLTEMAVQSFNSIPVIIHSAVSTQRG